MFAKRPQASAKRPQASAKRPQSVRKRPRRVGHAGESTESKIVAKRRSAVVTFYVSHYKSVNIHRDPGGSWSRNPELSSLLDSPRVFASQKCQHSQGSGGVVVAKPRTVLTFGLASGLRVSKVSTVTGIRGGRGREAQNCRHFWTRLASSHLKSVNIHRDPGGSWSRNPELLSFLDSSCVFASQKCQHSQGSGVVVVAKPRTVVTFGLASGLRVSKVSTVTGIRGGRGRESSLLDSPRVFAFQKC